MLKHAFKSDKSVYTVQGSFRGGGQWSDRGYAWVFSLHPGTTNFGVLSSFEKLFTVTCTLYCGIACMEEYFCGLL